MKRVKMLTVTDERCWTAFRVLKKTDYYLVTGLSIDTRPTETDRHHIGTLACFYACSDPDGFLSFDYHVYIFRVGSLQPTSRQTIDVVYESLSSTHSVAVIFLFSSSVTIYSRRSVLRRFRPRSINSRSMIPVPSLSSCLLALANTLEPHQ